MWREGSFTIDGVDLKYEAKVYAVGSRNGINNGRVSKLQIVIATKDDQWTWDNTIVNYDRGWDIRPKTELAKKALSYVLELYK